MSETTLKDENVIYSSFLGLKLLGCYWNIKIKKTPKI